MEPSASGEDQPEEREKLLQGESGSCSTSETVVSIKNLEPGQTAADMKEIAHKSPASAMPDEMASLEKALQDMEDDSAEETLVIESSPEKNQSEKTKDDSMKSSGEEVFSIGDEEEAEERPGEDEDEEENEEEEEDYGEMDDDEEIYVETTDRVDAAELSEGNSSESEISSDEYTDDEADREVVGERKSGKVLPTDQVRLASSNEPDDDDDVQILTDDDEIEEGHEHEEEEEEEEEEDEDMDGMAAQESIVLRKFGLKYDSDSSGSLVEKGPRLKVKYRKYQHKLAAALRKRSFKILNKRSMHVMEDSSDALVVCSDANLTAILKPTLVTPKEDADVSLSVGKPSTTASVVKPDTIVQTTSITTTTVDGSQSKTKEPEPVAPKEDSTEDRRVERDTEAESKEAISSTSDKMPTATAIEVPEKIADSSDDVAVSVVLSSKKSISAATTPSANSSAAGAQVDKGKEKESNDADTTLSMDVTCSKKVTVDSQEKQPSKSPATVEENEPTVDDVMEGLDDFMDHNGDEGKEPNGDFNEDLAFQMDVDEETGRGEKTTVPEQNADHGKTDKINEVKRLEESAMDLTSTGEPSKPSEQVVEQGKESVANPATTATYSLIDAVDSSPPPQCNERRPSAAIVESNVNMHDQTVVTSTPIITGSEKRKECCVPDPTSQEVVTQVKRETTDDGAARSGETEALDEVQNLSTSKTAVARRNSICEGPNVDPTTARKRRRSVDRDEAGQSEAKPEESVEPAKRLKLEVEANYQAHERAVNNYIEGTPNTSVDDIQTHSDTLVKEIQDINDTIRETEQHWNRLLHLKKIKEEILLILNRRKHVMGITQTRLGDVSAFSHVDSSNLTSQQQLNHHHRSSSVGPRPPTPPPEIETRPASVSTTMNYSSHSASNGVNSLGGKHSQITNRRNSSIAGSSGSGSHSSNNSNTKNTGGKRSASARDASNFVSQFNHNNNAVTMVPLNTTNMIIQNRASMNAAEIAKENAIALQVQRQLFPKPVLSNQQQILNNLAVSAGLTSLAASGAGTNTSTSTSAATVRYRNERKLQADLQAAMDILRESNHLAGITSQALLNGHHDPSGSTASRDEHPQSGRQGMRRDVSSLIADYRQKHPENVPRRGRRLKQVGGNNNGIMGTSSTGHNNIGGSFAGGGAISLTALPGGGKTPPMGSAARSTSDMLTTRLSELLAAAQTSRPSSNDSSQSSSNLLSSLVSASGTANTAGSSSSSDNTQQQFIKDVLVQFAKMSQNEQSLLSNLQLLANNTALASAGSTITTNTVSSPQQSPEFMQQQPHHQQQQQQHTLPQLHASLVSKATLPEVTLHPVMNSTAHSDILGSHNSTSTLVGANLSAVNNSTNSLLHGILTKSSASRPASGAAANTFNSSTLARLLTGPERANAGQSTSTSSTVTSGALANLQTAGVIGGLNLSKNNSEISITPVVGSSFQQSLLAQQQQQHQQQQLQRLRDQHSFKGDSYLNLDDEADDSVDRLVIDEGDDMGGMNSKRRVAEINENEVPQCQGCKRMEAKFVCAGCNHQWYCSRECQVSAWDDHSEVCSG